MCGAATEVVLKILQVAPLWESVPPHAYGGTEAVVHVLVEELVRRGHEVTLCASGDSRTSARLIAHYPRSLRTAELENKAIYSWQHAALSLKDARHYDIVHNHAGEEVMALAHLIPDVPMLTTMHCLVTPDTQFIWDRYPGHYNTISRSQYAEMPQVSGGIYGGVVYNGIDVASFPLQTDKDDHLLFLSRISPEKGPHLAVEAARLCGKKLIMAGKIDSYDQRFFDTTIAPLIDGDRVVFVGEADATKKRELYKNAACVLMPLTWEEPFGLVLAEAQACGTPVIAFNRGAAAEIVTDGITGFVVDTVEQMAGAVLRLNEIDPLACRRHVEDHFDGRSMADRYLHLYQSIIEGQPVGRPGGGTNSHAPLLGERLAGGAQTALAA